MKKLYVGVIGGGGIAQAEHLPAYYASEYTDIVAIAEPDDSRRRSLRSEFEIDSAYRTGAEMIERESLDIVSICSPPSTHEDLFVMAAENDCAVFCEKPLAPTLAEAESMRDAAEAAGIVAQVGYKYRFSRNFQKVLRAYERDTLGTAKSVALSFHSVPATRGWYDTDEYPGGGVLKDVFCHHLDYFLELFDTFPTVEHATVESVLTDEVEDYAEISLSFDDVRVTATVSQIYDSYAVHRAHLACSDGIAEFNPEHASLSLPNTEVEYKYGHPPDISLPTIGPFFESPLWFGAEDDVGTRRIRDFIDCVRESNPDTPAPIERGRAVCEITKRIYEAAGLIE